AHRAEQTHPALVGLPACIVRALVHHLLPDQRRFLVDLVAPSWSRPAGLGRPETGPGRPHSSRSPQPPRTPPRASAPSSTPGGGAPYGRRPVAGPRVGVSHTVGRPMEPCDLLSDVYRPLLKRAGLP